MGIPLLANNGNLPSGIWPCTRTELESRFGQTRRRRELPRLLSQFLVELRRRGIHGTVLVDGSFVTADPAPKDVDIVVVIPRTSYPDRITEVKALKRTWAPELDITFVAEGTPAHKSIMRFFGEDRSNRSRGLLRLVSHP